MVDKLKMPVSEVVGIVVQAAGILVVMVGVAVEVQLGAEAGFICITAGSLGFALGTKLRGK